MNSTFQAKLAKLLNEHGLDNSAGVPDFILADYLCACLDAYVKAREDEQRHSHGPELPSTNMVEGTP